jgi:hypothetical protein
MTKPELLLLFYIEFDLHRAIVTSDKRLTLGIVFAAVYRLSLFLRIE